MILLLVGCAGIDPTQVHRLDTDAADSDVVDSDPPDDTPEGGSGDTPTDPPIDSPLDPADCGGLAVCYGECVDVDVDPDNCGGCGRTCVLPAAEPACVLGACGVASCHLGFADCDGDPLTGCEAPDTCARGAACPTTCGTTGALDCADVCAPTCVPPREVCNAEDDDCDGACDQGLSCRHGIHRAYRGDTGHLFTRDLGEAQAYGLEAANFFYLYPDAGADLRPFFRCALGPYHFYTVSNDCEGTGGPVDTLGFIAPPGSSTCGAVPLYRLYHPVLGWHFYTVSAPERDGAVAGGWVSEGEAGAVWLGP